MGALPFLVPLRAGLGWRFDAGDRLGSLLALGGQVAAAFHVVARGVAGDGGGEEDLVAGGRGGAERVVAVGDPGQRRRDRLEVALGVDPGVVVALAGVEEGVRDLPMEGDEFADLLLGPLVAGDRLVGLGLGGRGRAFGVELGAGVGEEATRR